MKLVRKVNTNIKMHEFELAVAAAKAAALKCGNYLKEQYFHKKHIITYENNHEKTDDDVIAENIILEELKKNLPSFSYISEETQLITNDAIQFIIDPIEGTSNYVHQIPFFATQIAINYKGILSASFIYEPLTDTLCHAILGYGAFANKTLLAISNDKPIEKLIISCSSSSNKSKKQEVLQTMSKLIPQMRTARMFGSTGLELAYLAQGKLDVHINIDSKTYDVNPGILLVKEAGGEALSFSGKNWKSTDTNFIAASKQICSKIASYVTKTSKG